MVIPLGMGWAPIPPCKTCADAPTGRPSPRGPWLSPEQRLADLSRAERHVAAKGVAHLARRADAQRVQHRRLHVLRRVRIVGGMGGEAVGLAQHPPAAGLAARN